MQPLSREPTTLRFTITREQAVRHRIAAPRVADCDLLYTHKRCAHVFAQARGGSGAWYAMELTELLPHVARALHIDRDEATRYAGLTNSDAG